MGRSTRVVVAVAAVLVVGLVAACSGDDGEVVVSGADGSASSSAAEVPTSSAPATKSTVVHVVSAGPAPTTTAPGSIDPDPPVPPAPEEADDAESTGPYPTVPHDDPPAQPDGPTTTAPGASAVPPPTATGFTLTVGARLDPCDHMYASPQMRLVPCYDVLASWDDPGDPDALWNLVPGDSEFHPELVTVPLGPWHYPSVDGRVTRHIGVREATTVCVRLAVYHAGTVVLPGSDFDMARACVTTPGDPAAPTTTTSTTDPTATTLLATTTTT